MVSSVSNTHNHLVSKHTFDLFLHNRKFPEDIKKDTIKLLQMKVNKLMLREDLENKLGKCITLKDIINLQQYGKHENNNFQDLCDKIRLKFGKKLLLPRV